MRNSWLSLKKGQNAEEALIFVMEDLLGKKEDSSICQDAGVQACMICLEDMGDSDRLWGANIKISPFKEFLWCLVEYEEILSFSLSGIPMFTKVKQKNWLRSVIFKVFSKKAMTPRPMPAHQFEF